MKKSVAPAEMNRRHYKGKHSILILTSSVERVKAKIGSFCSDKYPFELLFDEREWEVVKDCVLWQEGCCASSYP